jgi:serine/threonine protein kinase
MFNPNQPSYQNLRSIVRERTNRVIAWIGSGLSTPAGLPTWSQLRARLCTALDEKSEGFEQIQKALMKGHLKLILDTGDYWLAFQLLRDALGPTSYRAEVRKNLEPKPNIQIPTAYHRILDIPVTGIFNLNLDRLATRAFSEKSPGKPLIEFNGNEVGNYFHILKAPTSFIFNLHGVSADESSWVFTRSELNALLGKEEYRLFITSCLVHMTMLFIGISADDAAIGGHLRYLSSLGIDFGQHFWLTNRSDAATDAWAEDMGIQVIRYSAVTREHTELSEILADVSSFQPSDSNPPPVTMLCQSPALTIRSPEQLHEEVATEKLRDELNSYASSILSAPSQESYDRYEQFCKDYDEAIYRAWYLSTKPPDNRLFGYELEEEIAEGAFGRVFRAKKPNGKYAAIKILKEDLRRKKDMLQSFRRGVRSMRILADRKVDGMVPYEEASEIPAFCVMDFIDGPNLAEAVQSRSLVEWDTILEVAVQLAKIIRTAHRLPERVLHRDLRPPNIMLKGYYSDPDVLNVVVLDFDLSWHMGAYELSLIQKSISGYLAPEQVYPTPGISTRNAAVDSFGLGMTLYFIRTGKEPQYLQHKHETWNDDLLRSVIRHNCPTWTSLPRRYARLIRNATKDIQSERWDMSQIEGELQSLREALIYTNNIQSSELLAEELAHRVLNQSGYSSYEWDADKLTATVVMPSGVLMQFVADERLRMIKLRVEWSNKDDRVYRNIRKYLKPAMDGMISSLKSEGWRLLPETTMTTDLARFGLEAVSTQVRDGMDHCVAAITKGLGLFQQL